MSDTEDQMILEEIRALENVLSRKNDDTDLNSDFNVKTLKTEIVYSIGYPTEETAENNVITLTPLVPVSDPFINAEENVTESSSLALHLNEKLIEQLLATRAEVASILEECKRRKEIIIQKIKQRMKTGGGLGNSKTLSSHAGMPYFKDKDFFSAPPNMDTKLKQARAELQIIHLRRVSRWTAKDKVLLLKSIHSEVLEKLQKVRGNETMDITNIKLEKNNTFPDIVVKAIGPLGAREFDWMKIAATDFQNKHSAEECRVMWQIFLHPDINKFKWKRRELSDLEKYVKQFKNENWDAIARKLGTQRSGYQCFVKYNTMKKLPQNDKPWTKQEDKKLVLLINKFRIGDFINWGDIASCIETRTKHQIYFRWMYSLAPHLKKGRFTEEEDKLLSEAIEKYGTNFKKISCLVLPARTSAQLSDHYNTLANKDENIWTVEQDEKLLSLHKEHGTDWAKIATFFENKSRVQLRHRRSALARYEKRGVSLQQIPRNNFRDKFTSKDIIVFQKAPMLQSTRAEIKALDDVDMEFIEYFQSASIPKTRVGRRQKFYNSKELEATTRQMYNILHLMSANLCIPDDLEPFEILTEKDKQLLYALKNLPNNAIDGEISRKVEQMRHNMFNDRDSKCGHFIPPLPFGGHIRSNKSSQMINYSLYIDTRFTENWESELETPRNILSVIGEAMSEEFDKIGELLARPISRREHEPIERIYILGPGDLVKKEVLVESSSVSKLVYNLFQSSPSTSRHLFPRSIGAGYKNNNDIDMDNFPSIKPNYWTLLGYQGIQSVRRTMNFEERIDEFEDDTIPMTENGRKALALLRTRLVQLFKFPIIMSQIMPPETIEDRSLVFLPEQRVDSPSTSPTRKRRKIEKNIID